MNETIVKELYSLAPSSLIELWELDATVIGQEAHYFFHDGTNSNLKPITFAGQEYVAFPIKGEQFEKDGKGSGLARPKLSCANINGFVSILLLGQDDLIGAKVVRKKVFVRSLDDVNFPNGTNPWGMADPTAIVGNDTFYINRKIAENNDIVSFELATPIEIDNVKLPKRQMLASCGTCRYRNDETCGYTGAPVADKNNKLFYDASGYGFTANDCGEWSDSATYNQGDYVYRTSILMQTAGDKIYYVCSQNGVTGATRKPSLDSAWIADQCPLTVWGCKLRFPTGPLPYGGFIGLATVPYQN